MLELPHASSVFVSQDGGNVPRAVEAVRTVQVTPLAVALHRFAQPFSKTSH